MKWGLIIAIWLILLVIFFFECFRLLTKGEKKELWVFSCWLFLLGLFISINVYISPAEPRFAEWILHCLQG